MNGICSGHCSESWGETDSIKGRGGAQGFGEHGGCGVVLCVEDPRHLGLSVSHFPHLYPPHAWILGRQPKTCYVWGLILFVASLVSGDFLLAYICASIFDRCSCRVHPLPQALSVCYLVLIAPRVLVFPTRLLGVDAIIVAVTLAEIGHGRVACNQQALPVNLVIVAPDAFDGVCNLVWGHPIGPPHWRIAVRHLLLGRYARNVLVGAVAIATVIAAAAAAPTARSTATIAAK